VLWRERHSLAEVRPEVRNGKLPRDGIETEGRLFSRSGRLVVDPNLLGLRLVERNIAIPFPVEHRGIHRDNLLVLVVRSSRLSLRRHHHFHPILDRNLRRLSLPIGLIGGNFKTLAAEPIDTLPDQFGRVNCQFHFSFPVWQFSQRGHDVVLRPGSLEGIIDPPEAPHSGDIMLRNVTVKGIIPCAISAAP